MDEQFDWVEARSKCTLAKAFQRLRLGVQSDVKARNSLRGETPYYEFSVISEKANDFMVLLSGNTVEHHTVAFGIAGNEIIAVSNGNQESWNVSVTLDDDAQCRLKTKNGKELTFWQFRRLTLEKLFFQTVPREIF